jgi:hypothetical protein
MSAFLIVCGSTTPVIQPVKTFVQRYCDLQQQGPPGGAALGPASGKMVVETAWCVWLRRHHGALWQFVEPHLYRDRAPVEPRPTDNRGDAVAGKL